MGGGFDDTFVCSVNTLLELDWNWNLEKLESFCNFLS